MTKVHVAFICDNHYVIPTVVAITSLLCNKNPDTYYDIYIIAADLSETVIEKFYEFRESKSDIHIIKVSLKKFKDMQQYGHVNASTYMKFDLPQLISNQDKVLYLDSDIIIQKDLSDLFETNINDYYAGAVEDIGWIVRGLNFRNHFNAGVMLLNLKLMRENNASTALLNIGMSADNLSFMDQDCFNILFDNKTKLLPVIYNCCYNIMTRYKSEGALYYINNCFGTSYSSLDHIMKDSYIIHFASPEKPWIYFDSDFVREWDEYFKKSPVKLYKLKRKSVKLRRFIASHNLIKLLHSFFQHWRKNGFKFAMGKVRKKLLKNIK